MEVDPVDGLRLALIQQRVEKLRARLRFRTFGLMEALPLLLLVIGSLVASGGGLGSYPRMHRLALGVVLIIQALGLWWYARRIATQELRRLQLQALAMLRSDNAAVITAAASAARTFLIDKRS